MSEDSVDISRLSLKAQVALGITLLIVGWVLSASAAYMGVQLALNNVNNKQERADERFQEYKQAQDRLYEEQKKKTNLLEMDMRQAESRLTVLEAVEKARSIIEGARK